jgi:hypothetical protein
MENGLVRIGRLVSVDKDDCMVAAQFDDDGVEVIWPRSIGFAEAFERNRSPAAPDPVIFRDTNGYLTLRQGTTAGMSMSTVGASEQRIHYSIAIGAGAAAADYEFVNGMASEVDGLAYWAKSSTVETRLNRNAAGNLERLELSATNRPDITLGGSLDLRLQTSYSHLPTPKNGAYTIHDRLTVQTRSDVDAAWSEHAAQHHMIQDLMCLVYGQPCAARLKRVMRADDQPYGTRDHRRWWADVYQPTFGRTTGSLEPLDDRQRPLFFLDETDPSKVDAWLKDFAAWSRPTWIAVTTLFQKNTSIESQLLQVGVALEALGYAIWSETRSPKSRVPSYPQLLELVTEAASVAGASLYGESRTAAQWRTAFNVAFKGTKHADNALTPPREAAERTSQGFLLIRCWLATKLGVQGELLEQRLEEM